MYTNQIRNENIHQLIEVAPIENKWRKRNLKTCLARMKETIINKIDFVPVEQCQKREK